MRNESDFSDVWDWSVVVLVEFCVWLVVWTLLVQARSTRRLNISVMCFILSCIFGFEILLCKVNKKRVKRFGLLIFFFYLCKDNYICPKSYV